MILSEVGVNHRVKPQAASSGPCIDKTYLVELRLVPKPKVTKPLHPEHPIRTAEATAVELLGDGARDRRDLG